MSRESTELLDRCRPCRDIVTRDSKSVIRRQDEAAIHQAEWDGGAHHTKSDKTMEAWCDPLGELIIKCHYAHDQAKVEQEECQSHKRGSQDSDLCDTKQSDSQRYSVTCNIACGQFDNHVWQQEVEQTQRYCPS